MVRPERRSRIRATGALAGALATLSCGPEAPAPITTGEPTGTTGNLSTGTGVGDATAIPTTSASTGTTASSSDASSGATGPGPTCEHWLDDAPQKPGVALSVRNEAPVPIFLSFHACAFGPPYRIESLADGALGNLGELCGTCEIPFCPNGCSSAGVFMVAPGGVFQIGSWGELVSEPDMRPAACSADGTDEACHVLRRATPGEYRLTVWYLDEVTGCDPDPCTCDLMGFDACQILPSEEVVGDRSASIVFTMPTAGPVEIGLSL